MAVGLLALLLLGLSGLAQADAAQEPDGPTILSEFITRNQVAFEMEQWTIRLVDRRDQEELREMRRYSRRFDDGHYRHLLVVDDPDRIAGTTVLAWQRNDGPDRFWTYLPALGQTRQQSLGGGSARSFFMGTDLTYEDVAYEDASRYDYVRMPDQVLAGVKVFVVRAVPANRESARASGYAYRDLYLDKTSYLLLKTDYYSRSGKLIKQLEAREPPEAIQDQAWRVDYYVINNIRDEHRTELIIRKRELEEIAVPKHLFRPQHLSKLAAIVRIRH